MKFKLGDLWFILLIPFIKPFSIEHFTVLSNIYDAVLVLAILIVMFLYIFKHKNISSFIVVLIVLNLIYVASAVINDGAVFKAGFYAAKNISICMLVEYALKENAHVFIKKASLLFSILVTINLLLFFIFPGGIYISSRWASRINFLNSDNGLVQVLIPAMAFAMIRGMYFKGTRKHDFGILAICVLTFLLTWAGSGIVAMFIFIGYLMFTRIKISQTKSFGRYIIPAYTAIFLAIIVMRKQEIFAFVIENVLHKDLTFTNRTNVWDIALSLIARTKESAETFLFGYGIRDVNLIKDITNGLYAHSHNEVFEIILQSGFAGLALFALLVYLAVRKLTKYRRYRISQVLTASLAAFLVVSLVDTCFTIPFYMILAMSFNVDIILKQWASAKKKAEAEDGNESGLQSIAPLDTVSLQQ